MTNPMGDTEHAIMKEALEALAAGDEDLNGGVHKYLRDHDIDVPAEYATDYEEWILVARHALSRLSEGDQNQ